MMRAIWQGGSSDDCTLSEVRWSAMSRRVVERRGFMYDVVWSCAR